MAVNNSIVHVLNKNDAQFWDENDRIVVHDNLSRQDFLNILSNMDLNLYVSYSESWGQVITESISCGVPCLVSNNSGIFAFSDELREELEIVEYDNS